MVVTDVADAAIVVTSLKLRICTVCEFAPVTVCEIPLTSATDATAPENVPVVPLTGPVEVSEDTASAGPSVTLFTAGTGTGDLLSVTTTGPLPNADTRARTPVVYGIVVICQIPVVVAELAGVPPAAGSASTGA
jgi:hypothetical protein